MGRRQESLGSLVPRTRTVALGPKPRSDLASRCIQRARVKRHGTQSPADRVDAWHLMGCGCLHFPTPPRQLPDLTTALHKRPSHHCPLCLPSTPLPSCELAPSSPDSTAAPIHFTAMAPRLKKGKAHVTTEPSSGPEPALDRSTVIN